MDITKNTQQQETKKKAKTKEELIKQIDNIESDITLKDKIKIYLTSFKVQFITFITLVYLIPFIYTLIYMFFLTLNQGTVLEILSGIFHVNDYYGIISKLDNIYVWLINIFQFGWLGNLIGIHVSDVVQFYVKILNVKSVENLGEPLLFTELTYIGITLIFNFIFAIIFRKQLDVRSKLSKLNEKLNEAYIKANNMNIKEAIVKNSADERKLMQNFEKDSEELKKIKKQIIEILKTGKYDRYEAKETFQIAFDNYDSPFANQVAGIVNKSILKSIEELEKIENDEEFYAFIFDKFSDYQKDIIMSYNFYLFNENEPIKKYNAGFKKEWLKIKEGNIDKETYIKILSIIYYFKNYPLSLAIKYLKYKKNININKQEKLFIENFRWIVNYFLKKEQKPDMPLLDLPLSLMFPMNIKGKKLEALKNYYVNFLQENLEQSITLKGIKKPKVNSENESNKEYLKKVEEDFNKKVELYINFVKTKLLDIYEYLLKQYDINIKNIDNLNLSIRSAIFEHFKFKEHNRNFNENKIIVDKLSVFNITDFYMILDRLVKKKKFLEGKNLDIKPFYEEYFFNMNVFNTFLYMSKDKESIYQK